MCVFGCDFDEYYISFISLYVEALLLTYTELQINLCVYIVRYDVKLNNAILAEEKHLPMWVSFLLFYSTTMVFFSPVIHQDLEGSIVGL